MATHIPAEPARSSNTRACALPRRAHRRDPPTLPHLRRADRAEVRVEAPDQRRRLEPVEDAIPFPPLVDELRPLQDCEVPRDRGRGYREASADLPRGELPTFELLQHLAPRRVGQGPEDPSGVAHPREYLANSLSAQSPFGPIRRRR